MNVSAALDLDMPGRPLSLLHPYGPHSMTFLHRGQTRAQVVDILYRAMYTPETSGHRAWLLSSLFECVVSFVICSVMIVKKKSLGKLWIVTKRDSAYGAFYVANAVFCLVIGVAVYLMAWDLTVIVIVAFSFAGMSSLEWWWIVPAPWWPLAVGTYVSIHGFVIGCSPRSPLSSPGGHKTSAARKRWYYLPVSQRPWIVNATLIVPMVLFSISTFSLVAMSGRAYYRAKAFGKATLPADILLQIHRTAHASVKTSAFIDGAELASDDLLWAARRVVAAYSEVHRYVCINLAIFAFIGCSLWIPACVYGLPNIASLLEHAFSRLGHLPPSCDTFWRKTCFLLTKGKPTNESAATYLSINTWKMTILAIAYVLVLVSAIPAFVLIPIFIIARSFPHQIQTGDFSQTLRYATMLVSIVTILACTFVAGFCTVATLDPLFRSVIGLNVIRNQIPIDIEVIQHESMVEDGDSASHACASDKASLDLGSRRAFTREPNPSILTSTGSLSPKVEMFAPDTPSTAMFRFFDDIESHRHASSTRPHRRGSV